MKTRTSSYTLSHELSEYMKNNHLCYTCGDIYGPVHQCKRKQLIYFIEELEPNKVIEEANAEVVYITCNIVIEGLI